MRTSEHRIRSGGRSTWLAVLSLVLFAGFGGGVSAAEPEVAFEIQPKILSAGEVARAIFVIRGIDNPPPPDLPQTPGLQIQSSGTTQQIQILNGRTSREIVVEYQLLAEREGKFTVAPLPYEAGGRTWTFQPVEIEVSAAADPSGTGQDLSEVLFARVEASRSRVYVQENLPVMLSVYSRPDVPLGPEMSLEDLPSGGVAFSPWEEVGQVRERVNGVIYDVRRFRARMQALAAGELSVAPKLKLRIRVPRKTRPGSPFDEAFSDMMFNRMEVRIVEVPVQPLQLRIESLPTEGRPAGFNGAVGRFEMDIQVEPRTVPAGDPVTLRITLKGEGNLDALTPPPFEAGPGFRAYDFRLVGQQAAGRGVAGFRAFERVLLPLSETSTNLPPVEFSYFDPEREAYETLRAGPFALEVKPAAEGAGRVVESATNGLAPILRIEGMDILYLKAPPRRSWPVLPGAGKFGLLMGGWVVPPLLAMLAWAGVRRRDRLRQDVALARRVRAPRMARKQLTRAGMSAREGDRRAVFEAIWQALALYFGNRLNLPAGAVNEEAVARSLAATDEGARLLPAVRDWFQLCEIERFGAGTLERFPGPSELTGAVTEVSRLLRACERVRMR